QGLNTYHYVPGRDPKAVQGIKGPVQVRVEEAGPLVASLVIESPAPGCRKLIRRLTLVDGLSYAAITNVVDKEPIRKPESVHFGFDLNVPAGLIRLDIPWAVIRPETDQLPGACKNYFTVGRWVDVSNQRLGLTCAVIDAPMLEVGAIRVDVPRPIGQPEAWVKHLEPTQRFFSYVMNNYWETNYKADQEGPTVFRYALRPHGPFDPADCARFGIERSQPLIAVPADPAQPTRGSMLTIEPTSVIVTMLRPSSNGRAFILRLFNASDKPAVARLQWAEPQPTAVSLCDQYHRPTKRLKGAVQLAPFEIVTLRAELAD
ncbi:MAG TPA: hypothetical protein EYP14_10150, partial [Planctomycetaceae bacterium]|nr:hypothetical protein [Planctomycetaceae bacterium]